MNRLRFLVPLLLLTILPACHREHLGRSLSYNEMAMLKRHETDVSKVLDLLHEAASRADADTYFGFFAPGSVFLGTDETERWSLDKFKQYAMPLFMKGTGWTYIPRNRHVWVSMDGWAVFDELLENAKYGTCRGSGSMRWFENQGWKIEQYDLSVPIPNDMLEDVARQIREFKMRPKMPAAPPAVVPAPPPVPAPVAPPTDAPAVPAPPATPPPSPTGQ